MRLHFLGANRQVTGSHYILEAGGLRIGIDCGLFQERQFLGRNWKTPLPESASIDFLLLTHAHLDHTGLIPRLVAGGFDRPIIATEPTVELASIVMEDSRRIHEEDAKYKKKRHQRKGHKGSHPIVPLYTGEDAKRAVSLLKGVRYAQPLKLNDHVSATFHDAGHILGSAILEIMVNEGGSSRRLLFSGDIGQPDKPLICDPSFIESADHVVLESTYGDRDHPEFGDVASQLTNLINDTVEKGGNIVIPTFAIERAQELMFHIGRLVHEDRIKPLPIYLDSPMAVDVTEVFRRHRDYLDQRTRDLFASGQPPLQFPGLKLVRSVDDSIAINDAPPPNLIMSASGMCTGGRIKHHLRQNIGQADSTIVFVGYQSVGTLGRLILDGHKRVRIHGRQHHINARIAQIQGFSAHGDRSDLLEWLRHLKSKPKTVFLTHGEESAALALASEIRSELDLEVSVPEYKDVVELE